MNCVDLEVAKMLDINNPNVTGSAVWSGGGKMSWNSEISSKDFSAILPPVKGFENFETNLVENIIFYTDWPAFVLKYLGGSILNRNLANLTKRLLNNIQQHI